MRAFAKMTALLGCLGVLGTSVAFAQAPPTSTPPIAPKASATVGGAHVKGYTRKTKSGKTITVKGYTRGAKQPKGTAVKGYTRKTKSGKTITVKGYTRKAPAKAGAKM